MIRRIVIACSLVLSILSAATAKGQPGDRSLDMKARVLDILFPLDVVPEPYFAKMILRFGDSDTQFVVVVYPGRKSELICYSLAGVSNGALSQMISKMVSENPDLKDQEIAAKLKVEVTRAPIEYDRLNVAIEELKSIRIAPVLAHGVAVDEFSEYEFWYDTWQESVHYTITSPFNNDSQDQLARWMIKFKSDIPSLLKGVSTP